MNNPHWLTRHRGKIVRIGTKLAVVCAVAEHSTGVIARVMLANGIVLAYHADKIAQPKDGDREKFDDERKRLALKSSRP